MLKFIQISAEKIFEVCKHTFKDFKWMVVIVQETNQMTSLNIPSKRKTAPVDVDIIK